MDFLDFAVRVVYFLLGLLLGAWLRGRKPERIAVAVAHGPDRVYARFCYKDGRVKVRPFQPGHLTPTMEWCGTRFKQKGFTVDGWTYEEING